MPKHYIGMAAACAALLSFGAESAPLAVDGQWQAFDVDDLASTSGGLEWIDLDGNPLTFDFTLSAAAVLRVVDAGGYSGDSFALFNGVSSLGTTSVGAAGGNLALPTDFDAAFADHAHFGYAEMVLAPGEYHLRGELLISALDEFGTPLNATVGAVSLSAPVPLPTPALLLGSAAGLLGFAARRRPA